MKKNVLALVMLFLATLVAVPASMKAQSVVPFISGGIVGSENTGFTKAWPLFNFGVEYNGSKLTSVNTFDLAPAISKSRVQGLGTALGGTSLNYWRVSPLVSLGGGVSGEFFHTSIWDKSNISLLGGALFNGDFGRVYLNYFHEIALDQNHLQGVKATWTVGRHRVKPLISYALTNYTEPSNCSISCNGYWGNTFEVGLKVLLTNAKE